MVGAVIVKDNHILSKGHHEVFGGPHAEVNAINHLPDNVNVEGATMYVTLEPCAHTGKTPPCVQMIVKAGIKRVVVGEIDPNPLVAGKGVAYLKSHGIKVVVLNTLLDANNAYRFYFKHHRPFVTLKYAMTVDGRLNFSTTKRSILTGNQAFLDNQRRRQNNQAILVGANTVAIDNPQLTIRKSSSGFPFIRLVVIHDANQIDFDAQLFKEVTNKTPAWILANKNKVGMVPDNVKVIIKPVWTATKICEYLSSVGIQSLLVEGGSQIFNQFVAENQFEQIITYVAPQLFGEHALPVLTGKELGSPTSLTMVSVNKLGNDVKLVFERSN
ncbi:diaminohydroxyphosphoribosylaminopyrimidine deaminase [Lentilactobacillus kosonis]|uniref:Riboflavin biosynthesis protein RibD n=2 Tax=Lentilactobacillus kosonis TaxID=2810561 RepID=A0A401FIW7_9LACO|nr:diaminohydroxyphosphoribosylaminopyrimidine deaminase [Lentilactobacillus kosonis]